MPYSHHSHSGQFCKHATGQLEEVVLEAVKRRFRVYGLTEHAPRYRHVDLYPEEDGLDPQALSEQFDNFISEARRLKSLYASQITLLVGVETEFITQADLDGLTMLLEKHKHKIEFLVGSIHHVNGVPVDFDRATYEKALGTFDSGSETSFDLMNRFLCAYLDSHMKLMSRFHPEVLGHLDLCRLYTPDLRFSEYPDALCKLERNINFAVEYGALFEINAAAFRKGWDTAYPGEDLLRLISKHGGKFVLSDDSHGPHAVGLNYDRMGDYLRRMGVTELYYLRSSNHLNAFGRPIAAVGVDGIWWKDSFWNPTTPSSNETDPLCVVKKQT